MEYGSHHNWDFLSGSQNEKYSLSSSRPLSRQQEEASEAAMKFMEKNYKQGVGFSGGGSASYRKMMIIAGIIIVGVVTYL